MARTGRRERWPNPDVDPRRAPGRGPHPGGAQGLHDLLPTRQPGRRGPAVHAAPARKRRTSAARTCARPSPTRCAVSTDEGLSADDMRAILASLYIAPVITAHPTNCGGAPSCLLRRHGRCAHAPSQKNLLPSEVEESMQVLRETIVLLWQSDETRDRRPTVLDEVRNGIYFFEATLFRLDSPHLHRVGKRRSTMSTPGEHFDIPAFLRYGSWIGGDRDGNPFVTVGVTEETLRTHKEFILRLYNIEVDKLYHQMSQSARAADYHQRPGPETSTILPCARGRTQVLERFRNGFIARSSSSCSAGCKPPAPRTSRSGTTKRNSRASQRGRVPPRPALDRHQPAYPP
ncbi:MAG: phosphoenolpyruvate carboxylase [Caldilineaceae bacterium]